jgi:hypothetical protein
MRLLSGAKFAAVVATAMILAGCGGDEGGSSSSTSGDKPVAPSPSPKNNPPVVSGAALTAATVGSSYVFQPTASDPDGDPIEYQVANKPDWAAFDARSGRLSGSPADGDVGTYANIVISVSDGRLTASLPPFSIAVSQTQFGAATLTWQPPTENTDGSPATDLAGYRIRYGQSLDGLSKVQDIANPGVTTAMVENLSTGTWYFTVTAYNRSGFESEPSNPAQKSVL